MGRAKAGCLALLAAGVITSSFASTSSGATSIASCTSEQLRAALFNSNGAAGTIVLGITLRNAGRPCSLAGYPALRLRSAHAVLPTRVLHGGLAVLDQRPVRVLLLHGARATTFVAYGDVPTGSEHQCPRSSALLVRPPGTAGWLTVAVNATVCDHGTLRESPVLAGARRAP